MDGIEKVLEFIRGRDSFILTTHDGADADGLGAELAMARALEALGKSARIVNSRPLAQRFAFMDPDGQIGIFEAAKLKRVGDYGLIVLDTSDELNLGICGEALISGARAVLVIDHHEPPEAMEMDSFIDPTASSTCELAYAIVTALGAPVDTVSAAAIYAGIVYDTGSFAYDKTSERTFRTALALVRSGVGPYDIYRKMYESFPIGSLLLQKRVLGTLELHMNGRVAVQTMSRIDIEETGASWEDAESLVNIPLRAESVEVSVFFKENLDGGMRCSFRSKGGVNVSRIAQVFGGGGHKTSSGFKMKLGLAETKKEVLERLAAALADSRR